MNTYFRKVFDVRNPNVPIKNKKIKIKKLLRGMSILDINNNIIGCVREKIIECNGIYYAECSFIDDEYKHYIFDTYQISYNIDKNKLESIDCIYFDDARQKKYYEKYEKIFKKD